MPLILADNTTQNYPALQMQYPDEYSFQEQLFDHIVNHREILKHSRDLVVVGISDDITSITLKSVCLDSTIYFVKNPFQAMHPTQFNFNINLIVETQRLDLILVTTHPEITRECANLLISCIANDYALHTLHQLEAFVSEHTKHDDTDMPFKKQRIYSHNN